jgi:hypothetical protein
MSSPGPDSAESFIKNLILTDLSQLSMPFEKKGQGLGGDKRAGNLSR